MLEASEILLKALVVLLFFGGNKIPELMKGLGKGVQLPLYVCAKEVVRLYRPLFESLGLTYTQYIAMMVLW